MSATFDELAKRLGTLLDVLSVVDHQEKWPLAFNIYQKMGTLVEEAKVLTSERKEELVCEDKERLRQELALAQESRRLGEEQIQRDLARLQDERRRQAKQSQDELASCKQKICVELENERAAQAAAAKQSCSALRDAQESFIEARKQLEMDRVAQADARNQLESDRVLQAEAAEQSRSALRDAQNCLNETRKQLETEREALKESVDKGCLALYNAEETLENTQKKLRSDTTATINELKSAYTALGEQLRSEHADRLEQLRTENTQRCERLESEHTERCDRLRIEHTEQCERLKSGHAEQCERLRSEYSQHYAELQEAVESWQEIEQTAEKLRQALTRETNKTASCLERIEGLVRQLDPTLELVPSIRSLESQLSNVASGQMVTASLDQFKSSLEGKLSGLASSEDWARALDERLAGVASKEELAEMRGDLTMLASRSQLERKAVQVIGEVARIERTVSKFGDTELTDLKRTVQESGEQVGLQLTDFFKNSCEADKLFKTSVKEAMDGVVRESMATIRDNLEALQVSVGGSMENEPASLRERLVQLEGLVQGVGGQEEGLLVEMVFRAESAAREIASASQEELANIQGKLLASDKAFETYLKAEQSPSSQRKRRKQQSDDETHKTFWTDMIKEKSAALSRVPVSRSCPVPPSDMLGYIWGALEDANELRQLSKVLEWAECEVWHCYWLVVEIESIDTLPISEEECPFHPEGTCLQVRAVTEDNRRMLDFRVIEYPVRPA
ncbi:hypothetical protein QQZ08_007173 [Neonectria magnoliae]|uniref:Uncharacterized protein n=1 Tax=Neonectria magnoliae TaxID=2732573 RepID=A0ABR1I022_9HYPO